MSEKHLAFSSKTILFKYDPGSKLKQYFDLLEVENTKINLVSRETSRTDLERLAAESLLPFETIDSPSFENYLDIGSGGGIPAFPIIMCLEIEKSTLVERTQKKAAALKRISDQLGVPTKVSGGNFEDSKFDGKFDLVTLRLVKLTNQLLKKIAALLALNGIFIYYSEYNDDSAKLSLSKTVYYYNTSQDTPPKNFSVFIKKS
ncbi:MAG: 16S rRNA (guanine(527)-N(7))-methyltransferase RsmG [Candidatus Zixiibacteriota bacterium]